MIIVALLTIHPQTHSHSHSHTHTHTHHQPEQSSKLFGFNCVTYHWTNGFCGTKQHLPTKITDWIVHCTHDIWCIQCIVCKSCARSFFLPLAPCHRTCRFTVFHKRNCYAKGHNEMQTQLDSNKTTMTTKAAAPSSLLPPLAISPPLSTKPTANNNNVDDDDDEGSHGGSKTTFQWQKRINERFSWNALSITKAINSERETETERERASERAFKCVSLRERMTLSVYVRKCSSFWCWKSFEILEFPLISLWAVVHCIEVHTCA